MFLKKRYTFKHNKKLMNKKFNSFNRFIAKWETNPIFPPCSFVNGLAFSSIKIFLVLFKEQSCQIPSLSNLLLLFLFWPS